MKRILLLAPLAMACNAGPDDPGVMYMPEMVVSTAYDAHDRNPILPNGMTLQAPPEGTCPQNFEPYHYGADEAAQAAEVANPIAPDDAAIARGRAQFETFCLVCHGARGDGDGPVVPPFPNPPSFHAERTMTMSDGQIFHAITHGKGLMPSYAAQVHTDDRWRIIHYLRTLQGLEPGSVPAALPAEPSVDVPVDAAVPEVAPEVEAPIEEAAPIDEAPPRVEAAPIDAGAELPSTPEPTGETNVR